MDILIESPFGIPGILQLVPQNKELIAQIPDTLFISRDKKFIDKPP
jgi:hypothetical protein